MVKNVNQTNLSSSAATLGRIVLATAPSNASALDIFLCIQAITANDIDKARDFITKNPVHVNALYRGNSLVYWATYYDRPEILILLLAAGAKPDIPGCTQKTALCHAAQDGFVACMQALIEANADLDYTAIVTGAHLPVTPLLLAVQEGRDAAAELLLDEGVGVFSQAHIQSSLLHLAAIKSSPTVLGKLLDQGLSLAAKDAVGATALHAAIGHNRIDNVQLLLKRKANPEQRDSDGWYPLHKAAIAQDSQSIPELCKYKCNLELKTPHGLTPLLLAVANVMKPYAPNNVQALLQAGAKVEARDANQATAIILLAQFASKYAKAILQDSPQGHHRQVALQTTLKLLVEDYHANVHAYDKDGRTALHYFAEAGFALQVAYLMQQGARADIQDQSNQTPLQLANMSKQVECSQVILAATAREPGTSAFAPRLPQSPCLQV